MPLTIPIFPPADATWFYLVTFSISLAMAVYLCQFRAIPGAMPLILNQSVKALWVASRILFGAGNSVAVKLFWVNFQHCLQIMLIVTWFEFVLTVSRRRNKAWLMFRDLVRWGAVCLTLTIVLDGGLAWYWRSFTMNGPVMRLLAGPANIVTAMFANLLYLVCVSLCLRWIVNSRGLLRNQALSLSLPSLFTIAGIMLGRIPAMQPLLPQLLGILLSGAFVTWAFYRWRAYSILPLARETVTAGLIDAMLVVDEYGTIVEMNETARTLFADTPARVGAGFADLAAAWPALDAPGDARRRLMWEIEQAFPEGARSFQAERMPLSAANHTLGSVYLIRDITRRKQDQARLMAQQKALAALAEQNRLGRELHDTQGQFPGYVKNQAQVVKLMLRRGRSGDAVQQLERLIAEADGACVDARESISFLKNAAGEWDFFRKLFEWLERSRGSSGMAIDYEGPQMPPARWIAPEAEIHLLRIIQEAIANARKHAMASWLLIRIGCGDGRLNVVIADNGRGFDAGTQTGRSGHGLGIIAERAAEMGGKAVIESAPEHGAVIRLSAPLTSGDTVEFKGETL